MVATLEPTPAGERESHVDGGSGAGVKAERSADELTALVQRFHDILAWGLRGLLAAVAEFDERRLWKLDGALSMPPWLVELLGVSFHTAHTWTKIAAALQELPEVAETFADGDLSFDAVQALARFVTPETDEEWAREAPKYSVDNLHRVARAVAPVTAEESEEAHAERSLTWFWGHRRCLELEGCLPEEDGRTVVNALERIMETLPARDEHGLPVPWEKRRADALVELAGLRVGADSDPDRATVVVHIDQDSLGGTADRGGRIEDGPAVSSETVRRLACDCRYQTVVVDEFGIATGVGRMQRSVPAALSRIIRERDVTCRWPGCNRTRRLHDHHVIFWLNGGRSDTNNLCCLCVRHHRLVHEAGYQITGNANAELTFRRPDGTLIGTSRPPP